MKEKTLIVLDSFEYKKQEQEMCEKVSDLCNPDFFYTKYENSLTEIFCKTKYVGSALQHLTYWLLSLYYAVKLVLKRNVQNIVFINPIVGIFFAMIVRVLGIKKKITIGGFLFENKKNKIYLKLRKAFVNYSYKRIDKIIVYGENEVLLYSTIFPALAEKFVFVQYGKDYNYQERKAFSHCKNYISSGGRSNRNFSVLCKAYDMLANQEFDCLIATRPECVNSEMEMSKARFLYGITLNQFGSFIENSKLFVLPLLETKISAGHMAMMEAMAVGTPIIVSDIPAIRNYVDEKTVFFFSPNSSSDLKDKIDYVLKNINSLEVQDKVECARNLYQRDYSFFALLRRIILVSQAG